MSLCLTVSLPTHFDWFLILSLFDPLLLFSLYPPSFLFILPLFSSSSLFSLHPPTLLVSSSSFASSLLLSSSSSSFLFLSSSLCCFNHFCFIPFIPFFSSDHLKIYYLISFILLLSGYRVCSSSSVYVTDYTQRHGK